MRVTDPRIIALALAGLGLTGCIERNPTGQDADGGFAPVDATLRADSGAEVDRGVDRGEPPDQGAGACAATDCADLPAIACPGGGGERCERDADGACQRVCEPVAPVECRPADCGAQPATECPADTREAFECVPDEAEARCVWQVECMPVGRTACRPDDCGPMPPGEACGAGTVAVSECREIRDQCEWYFACEPVGCQPADCGAADYAEPECDFVVECVTSDLGCDWRVTCRDATCTLPWDPGPCDEAVRAWWFNPESGACEQQTYGGCEGNLNRFASMRACREACAGGQQP